MYPFEQAQDLPLHHIVQMKMFLLLVLFLLTVCVAYTAIRIEVLNAQSEFYLPRKDKKPDGTFADGKWRVSLENTPRDQMRDVVQTFGMAQYLLAPLLFILSVFVLVKLSDVWARIFGVVCLLIALTAICLMFYREYFASLGS